MDRDERTGYRSGDPSFQPPPSETGSRERRAAPEPLCDLCGAPMLERHCKLLCRRCGYQRDCSDP